MKIWRNKEKDNKVVLLNLEGRFLSLITYEADEEGNIKKDEEGKAIITHKETLKLSFEELFDLQTYFTQLVREEMEKKKKKVTEELRTETQSILATSEEYEIEKID